MMTLSMTWLARPGVAAWIAQIRGGWGRDWVHPGFILGSDVRPALKTSHPIETQEPLGPNIFRLYSGKSNTS